MYRFKKCNLLLIIKLFEFEMCSVNILALPNTDNSTSSSNDSTGNSSNSSNHSTLSTFSQYLDDIIGVEAELVSVLSIVGVQRSALWRARLGFGSRFGSPGSRNRLHLLGASAVHSGKQEVNVCEDRKRLKSFLI